MSIFRNVMARLAQRRATLLASPAPTPDPGASPSDDCIARGNAALGRGELSVAAECYAQAVQADPREPRARLNLGFVSLEQGDFDAAISCLMQALALRRPGDEFVHEAHFLLGRAYRQRADAPRALASFEAALAVKPEFAQAMAEAAQVLHEVGRHEEASAWARKLASAQPSVGNRIFLAQELHLAGRSAEALEILDGALKDDPRNDTALRGRGHALLKLGRASEALAAYEQVLSLVGATPDGFTNIAGALLRLGRIDDALRNLDQALQLQPTHRGALCARVGALIEQLRVRDAIDLAKRALELYPDDADLHWNLAYAHLMLGNLQQGWEQHEWRARSNAMKRKQAQSGLAFPRWSGEDLRGRTILVVAEQGFGDSIQFVRYVPLVAKLAGSVLLDVPPALESLLQGLAPNCRILRRGEQLPHVDYHCALMSLPAAMGTTLANVPSAVPYLKADPALIEQWRQKLANDGGQLKVGLAWSGSSTFSNDHNRSMPLSALSALADLPCDFVTLQIDVRESDREAQRNWPGLRPGDDVGDFASTAALMETLDLVITVDTSIGHLAGALGRPVWILLSHFADWRWMLDRDDSPWYPTARLFRQSVAGDWGSVLRRVREQLALLANPNAPKPAGDAHSVSSAEWKARGNAALGQWDLPEAARCYRQAVAGDAADPLGHLNLGFVLLEQGNTQQAIESLGRALARKRDTDAFAHEAHFLLGRAHRQQGNLDKALECFEAAIAAKNDFVEPMEEAANLLHGARRHEEMLSWARRMQSARPGADADLIAAQALNLLKHYEDALKLLDSVLAIHAENASAWSGRGDVMLGLGRAEEALAAFERALALTGPSPAALTNAAVALARLGRHQEALQRLDRALEIDPRWHEALFRRGDVLIALHRVQEAIAFSSEALKLYPQDADLLWNRAMGQLLLGQYAEGWADYEHRWHSAAFGRRGLPEQFGRPRWTGAESLQGRTIWLQPEQGLGDTLHFLRYVPLVAARAAKVLLQVSPPLAVLAKDLAPNCQLIQPGEPLPSFDYVIPLMSLPLALGTTIHNIPADVPYLHADPSRVRAWRDRLDDGRLIVGLAWSGNASYSNDHNRSIPLGIFSGLATPSCRFVSLQPEVRVSDRQALEQWPEMLHPGDEIRDFAEAAALTCAVDVVVTVETSFAQLAAALARPVWVLLPHLPDWRWMLDREDSPWYPTARLYRQKTPGDWPSVLARVRGDLEARVKAPTST